MKENFYSVYLTHDELLLIDGKCNEKAQEVVEKAKTEYGFGLDPICNEILAKSIKTGKLTWRYTEISSCKTCDTKPSGYYKYARSSRYHRKGDCNYDAPFKYSGIEPNGGFISFSGMSGICRDCWFNVYLPKLVNFIIENDLPIEIQKNDIAETKYKKDDVRICYSCGEKMYESEMGRRTTLMGDGTYASKCPKCGAESLLFGNSHKITNEFTMRKITETNTDHPTEKGGGE